MIRIVITILLHHVHCHSKLSTTTENIELLGFVTEAQFNSFLRLLVDN